MQNKSRIELEDILQKWTGAILTNESISLSHIYYITKWYKMHTLY